MPSRIKILKSVYASEGNSPSPAFQTSDPVHVVDTICQETTERAAKHANDVKRRETTLDHGSRVPSPNQHQCGGEE